MSNQDVRFDWGDHEDVVQAQVAQEGDSAHFNMGQAVQIGSMLYNMSQSKKKGKKGKSAQTRGVQQQIEQLFLAGCAHLGIKVPPVVTRPIIHQVLSQAQAHFPQYAQIFALLGMAEHSGSGSGSRSGSSGSDSEKKKKKKKKKKSGSSKSRSGSDSDSDDKHKKKHNKHKGHDHDHNLPGGALPWAGVAAAGAYGGYPQQPAPYNPTSTYAGSGYPAPYANAYNNPYPNPSGGSGGYPNLGVGGYPGAPSQPLPPGAYPPQMGIFPPRY